VQMGYCNFVSMFRDEKWEGLPDRYETHWFVHFMHLNYNDYIWRKWQANLRRSRSGFQTGACKKGITWETFASG
jgi:hypothetical protein